jgi:hypothetical protein
MLVAAALALATTPYLVAYLDALSTGGFVLVYQTEHSGFSYSEHILINRILYGVACVALVTAICAIERKKVLAIVALLIAAPILVNDSAGAVYEFFGFMPWIPQEGPNSERFYNELKVPQQVWYVILAVVLVSALYCLTERFGLWRFRAAQRAE